MNFVSKKSIITALALATSAFAEELPVNVYTSSVRPVLKSCVDIFVEGSLLWWRATEDGLAGIQDLIQFPVTGRQTAPSQTMKTIEPHFLWDFGFQIGAGYNMPYDGWDLYASWIRFHPKNARSSVAIPSDANADTLLGPVEKLYPMFDYWGLVWLNTALNSQPGSSVHTSWKMHLDLLDLELGRESLFGQHLSLRPNSGLRFARITQTYKVSALDFIGSATLANQSIITTNKCDFCGIGPRLGLDLQWNFGYGISLFNDIAVSCLFGHTHISLLELNIPKTSNGESETLKDTYKRKHTARFVGDLDIGLRWQTTFDSLKCLGLMLQAGWEVHYFINQNQFISGRAYAESISNQGDLMTQGLTTKARIDF